LPPPGHSQRTTIDHEPDRNRRKPLISIRFSSFCETDFDGVPPRHYPTEGSRMPEGKRIVANGFCRDVSSQITERIPIERQPA
jgi:hypothetical protein